MDAFRKRIADILRIAVDRYGFGASRDLGQITKWDPKKGHVRLALSPDEWESLAETLFDLKLLKERIWDSKTKSFKIIEDHSPFYEALRKDPPKHPEWSGVFKKEGESRKVFQAFNTSEKREQQRLVNRIKKKYHPPSNVVAVCLAVSWYKSEDKIGGNKKLASIMTNKAKIKYYGAPYATPSERYKVNPAAFRAHLLRLRKTAQEYGFYKMIPPDYWKLYQ